MQKFFKWFFISFTSFLILLFLVTLFLDDKYSVKRSIKINANKDFVFKFVSDLRTWNEWNPWFLADTTMKNKIQITDSITGSKWEWESRTLGKGQVILNKVSPPDSIFAIMEFISPKHTIVEEYWRFKGEGNSTLIIWKHVGPLDYPLGRIFGLWSDNMLGPTFEEGLKLLKKKIENKN